MKCTEFVRKTKQRDASFDCQCVVEMYHEYGFIFSFFLSLSFVLSVEFWACGLLYWYIGCLSIASECNISPTLFVARTGTRISPANMRIQCMYSMRTIICISVCVLCRVVALQFTLFCMEQLYYYSVQCIMCLPRILMWIRIQFIKFAFCPLKFPSDTRRQNGQSCSNVVVKAFWKTGKKKLKNLRLYWKCGIDTQHGWNDVKRTK